MDALPTGREQLRLLASQVELVALMQRVVPVEGTREVLPGLLLNRSVRPVEWGGTLSQPAFCFVAQGSKHAMVGQELYRYDPGHYLLFTVDLPVTFAVDEASEHEPFLGL